MNRPVPHGFFKREYPARDWRFRVRTWRKKIRQHDRLTCKTAGAIILVLLAL